MKYKWDCQNKYWKTKYFDRGFGRREDKENTQNNANRYAHFMSPKDSNTAGDCDWKTEKWILLVATGTLPQGDTNKK